MRSWIHELIRCKDLLFILTWKEIRIKYKQSVMGLLWALLMPMLIVIAGVLVKFAYAKVTGVPLSLDQVATVSVKAIPWAFFIAALRFGTISLTGNANLVTKIYFPKEIFPLSAVLSQAFDLMVASVCLAALLLVTQVGLSLHVLWVPLLMVTLMVFVTGLVIGLSAANLFFRDVKYLVEVFATFAIFITPVFYESSLFGEWEWVLLLNPVAVVLEGLNDSVVLHKAPELAWLAYSIGIAVATFLVAYVLFKRVEPQFAEVI